MSTTASELPERSPDDPVVCYRHPDRETRLRCSRCERPICGACSTPATVGQHCPECIGEARRSAPKIRSAMTATAPVIVGLVVINALVYLVQIAGGGSAGIEFTVRWAQIPTFVEAGEWWRLLTAMFLHSPSTIIHILFNMFVLWSYGPNVEDHLGHARFLVAYLAAGFFASSVSYAFGPCTSIGVGASGAIFGVVGILLMMLHRRRTSQFVADHYKGMLAFIGINLVIGFVIPRIDWRAHMGGLVAGLILGAGLESRGGLAGAVRQVATFAAVIGLGVGLTVWRTSAGCGLF